MWLFLIRKHTKRTLGNEAHSCAVPVVVPAHFNSHGCAIGQLHTNQHTLEVLMSLRYDLRLKMPG
jgi:hypothetical protein